MEQHPIAIILGGGKGTRLYPLTKERAKPAVPFAGKYRLIDISMSNCINAGFRQIYILTQFNSASLHTHLSSTYIFDSFSNGFVEILAAEQNFHNSSWYEGTADAVRKNLQHFHTQEPSHFIILSGDQLYRMDLRRMYEHHLRTGAEVTIGTTPVERERASNLGIVSAGSGFRVLDFCEKPGPTADISCLSAPASLVGEAAARQGRSYLGSMGMYIFNADALEKALDNSLADFGHEIIPRAIENHRVFTYVFDGYWVDIGTIRSFYDTHLDLASPHPSFNFYDEKMPIYTHRKHLPATKIINCSIYNSLAAEGSIIRESSILNSVIGIRTVIQEETTLDGVICMGADTYETPEQVRENSDRDMPNIGIGKGSFIRGAIIDINSRIGKNCRIGADGEPRTDGTFDTHHVRDGIIVIPKNSVIPDGTHI